MFRFTAFGKVQARPTALAPATPAVSFPARVDARGRRGSNPSLVRTPGTTRHVSRCSRGRRRTAQTLEPCLFVSVRGSGHAQKASTHIGFVDGSSFVPCGRFVKASRVRFGSSPRWLRQGSLSGIRQPHQPPQLLPPRWFRSGTVVAACGQSQTGFGDVPSPGLTESKNRRPRLFRCTAFGKV